MTGKNFKQGYTCNICMASNRYAYREEALYRRTKEGYRFMGKVLCRTHGIQDAVRLSEVR